MPAGRPPRPIEQKRRTGNPGKRALPARADTVALAPAARLPQAPRSLGRVGREHWRRLWRAAHAWLSPATDLALLVRLCEAYDERAELQEIIGREGRTVVGSTGSVVTHPVVRQLRTLETLITRWESLCGFTPSDRSRLGMAEVQRVSKLESFLAQRSGQPAQD